MADNFGTRLGSAASILKRNRAPRAIGSPLQASSSGILDDQALQELRDIQLQNLSDQAEYSQRVGVANADANYQRGSILRDLGIAQDTGQRSSQLAGQSYNDLITNLQGIIPGTQASYDQGVQSVNQDYQTGVAQSQGSPVQANSLESQLAQLTGGQTDNLAQTVQAPSTQIQALLQGSGQAAANNLQTLGQGDVAAAQNALPGYGVERDQRLSDIDLETGAQLANLRNDLAGVHADFVPFNEANLELQSRAAVRQAIEQSMNRAKQAKSDIKGFSGVNTRAAQLGRPDLAQTFLDMDQAAREGSIDPSTGQRVYGDQALFSAINNYQSEENKPSYRQIATVGKNEQGRAQIVRGGGLVPTIINPLGGKTQTYQRDLAVPTGNKQNELLARQRAENDRRMLLELYNVYNGNYG